MRVPIAYVLAWPERIETPAERLDLASLKRLDFEAPDIVRFPALALARTALEEGGAAPIVLNAANEVAVGQFLEGRIGFTDIAGIVEKMLEHDHSPAPGSVEDVVAIDQETRACASELAEESCP